MNKLTAIPTLPCVQSHKQIQRCQETHNRRDKHHVQDGPAVFCEGHTAPGRFLNHLPIVGQVVHLCEEEPGGGGYEADQPD